MERLHCLTGHINSKKCRDIENINRILVVTVLIFVGV